MRGWVCGSGIRARGVAGAPGTEGEEKKWRGRAKNEARLPTLSISFVAGGLPRRRPALTPPAAFQRIYEAHKKFLDLVGTCRWC